MSTIRGPDVSALCARLEAMGVKARPIQGGRCALASLRLSSAPFEGLGGPARIENVVFSTVGPDRIKCLRPRALFGMPMVRILDCTSAGEIELRIRRAWDQHLAGLREAKRWLAGLEVDAVPAEQGSCLRFPVSGESQDTLVTCAERGKVILPSAGPLAGVPLHRAEDRVMRLVGGFESSSDVEIAVSNRMEELRRMDERLGEARRRQALERAPVSEPASRPAPPIQEPLLLVGPGLAGDRHAAESLRLRGYRVHVARTQESALAMLNEISPSLVLVDATLDGRGEGIELIPALRRAPGVEELPVVLVDRKRRAARREAARRAGAVGYLVHPIDVPRIAKRLESLVREPRRRRFTRFARRVSVAMGSQSKPLLATVLGRGGMFLSTDESLATHHVYPCRLKLPELGRVIQVDAEALYRVSAAGESGRGVGLRFHHFSNGGERTYIQYLGSLEPLAAA